MPWLELCAVDQRLRFVAERLSGEASMAELCDVYGISRKTGYKWLSRYEAEGPAGLADRSHAPLRHGRATAPELVEKIVELRRARPNWGPRKIVAKLEQEHPSLGWPSHSVAGELLKRAGLVSARRQRRRAPPRPGELTCAERPNHVWAVDHKGWVRLGDGQRCEPFTITDSYSRFLVALSAGGSTRESEARPVLQRAFAEYGLPEVILSDNGSPFACAGTTGLTSLSIWWAKLGIRHERIRPGKPQENGRHERFHRTLLEAMSPPSADRQAQVERFELFRSDYNTQRPHQALGQLPPTSFFKPSPRPIPERLPEPDYPSATTLRRVRSNGEVKWAGDLIHICSALAGEIIAFEPSNRGWTVWFYKTPIGLLDHNGRKLSPIHPG